MPRINPRDLVRESLHLDELSDDPEFRKAMQHAAAVGQATEALRDLVRGFVRRWIGRLL
jgi:hypothetical protein